MDVTVYQEVPLDLAGEWNSLLGESRRRDPFYTCEWAAATASAFSDRQRPLVVAMRTRGGSLAGIAALAIRHDRSGMARFLNMFTADRCDVVSATADRPALLASTLDVLRDRRLVLMLAKLPEDSPTVAALESEAGSARYRVANAPPWPVPRIVWREPAAREELDAILKGRQLRRLENRLARMGEVTVRHWTDAADIEARLPWLFEAHIGRASMAGRRSQYLNDRWRQFTVDAVRRLDATQAVVLSELLVDGRPLACHLGLVFGSSWFYYVPTFDVEYAKLAPGRVLLKRLLESALDRPDLDTFDFGIGTEPYKLGLANAFPNNLRITLSSRLSSHAVETLRLSTRAYLRRSPALWDKAVRARIVGGRLIRRPWVSSAGDEGEGAADPIRQRTSAGGR